MDKMISDMLSEYFSYLEIGEEVSNQEKRKLLALIYLYKVLYHFYKDLSVEDVDKINQILECIYKNNCLISEIKYLEYDDVHSGKALYAIDLDYGLVVFSGPFIDTFDNSRMTSILNYRSIRNFSEFLPTTSVTNSQMIVGYDVNMKDEIQIPSDAFMIHWGVF